MTQTKETTEIAELASIHLAEKYAIAKHALDMYYAAKSSTELELLYWEQIEKSYKAILEIINMKD